MTWNVGKTQGYDQKMPVVLLMLMLMLLHVNIIIIIITIIIIISRYQQQPANRHPGAAGAESFSSRNLRFSRCHNEKPKGVVCGDPSDPIIVFPKPPILDSMKGSR